ncbi:MAG TPA: ABC transporter permease subunit [Pirellulales bacterium]|nr:ABC transporter permease subunit [Pirellulales bacterium]
MFVGPVFTRELATAPRRARLYLARAAYVAVLLVLMATAWQVLAGTQEVRNVGDLARFGAVVFQILAPLQLAVVMFFAALAAASAVAAEKDRQTLILLLLTNLSNMELVLGKLLASMLNVLVLISSALPVFMLLVLLGGVSFEQVARVFAVTVAGALAAGSLGALLAFWREKTFQTLAMTALALVFWLAAWEAAARGAAGEGWFGLSPQTWATAFSPWQAMLEATRPAIEVDPALGPIGNSVNLFLLVAVGMTCGLNLISILMVRVWNPSREMRRDPESSEEKPAEAAGLARQPGKTREVWDNPIIWREMRTWAYGRKILAVRLAYGILTVLAFAALYGVVHQPGAIARNDLAVVLAPFGVLSLVLLNAQAVTSLTSERDAKAIDLLLVTDLTPGEVIYGKLGGVFYNTKEMWLLPMAMCFYLWWSKAIGLEDLSYLLGGWLALCAFAAMLGIHSGMNYASSRGAIAVSLGTVFFLFVGVAVCMRIMVAFSGSFQVQLQPFLAFMVGGGIGLYVALGIRNPSPAIQAAAFGCPFAIFYAITSLLLGYTLAVFLVVAFTFGFTTAAMLIPALFEFDVATGRTTGGEE